MPAERMKVGSKTRAKQEPDTERVIFRKYPDGEVIALFPDLNYTHGQANVGMVESYMHIGQHSEADPLVVLSQTKAATPAEYADLKAELENYPEPYHLRPVKRTTWRLT